LFFRRAIGVPSAFREGWRRTEDGIERFDSAHFPAQGIFELECLVGPE